MVALLTVSAAPAYAHSGQFVTTVTGVTPAFPGVSAVSTRDGEHFTLTSEGPQTLEVVGYYGEPFLRIDAAGVWKNRRSPTAYDDSEEPQTPPGDVSAKARPQWVLLGPQHQYTWHDHRTHWMSSVMPSEVQSDPDHAHLIRDWTIPLDYGGKSGVINGTLTYVVDTHVTDYLTWGAIGTVVVAFCAIQFGIRPRRRRREASSGD